MKKHQILSTALAFSFFYLFDLQYVHSQNDISKKEIIEAIDSIFADKKSMTAPGASVIIMKGKDFLMTKNYGAANLAFSVPFDENTLFPLEGFTEQLVVYSILQLEKKGRIRLDDSVNKYLPNFNFPDQVSLSHLLNHSSDLPMISSLRLLAGWTFSDPFTHSDFLDLTKRVSTDLHPDRKFIHNHGGIKILMMVVEKVSGISFSDYTTSNIFAPLDMTNSTVRGVDTSLSKNNSVGYTKTDSLYHKVNPIEFEVFCPKTFTTQSDFKLWMANVQSKEINGDIIERMDEALTINGKSQERTYGTYCTGQQQCRHYLGQDEFYMRDTGNGYSWMWLRLNQAQLSVMVVGNLDTYIGSKVNGIADLLGEYVSPPISADAIESNSTPIELTLNELELFKGTFWNEEYMYTTEISIKDGKLYHSDTDNGFNFHMTPITKTSFITPFGGTVEFTNLGGDQTRMKNIIPNGREFDYKQYAPPAIKEGAQLRYVGVYTSSALNILYQIVWEADKLILRRNRKPDLEFSPIGENQFRTSEIDFRMIEFKDEVEGVFQEMNISNPSLKNIAFRKLK